MGINPAPTEWVVKPSVGAGFTPARGGLPGSSMAALWSSLPWPDPWFSLPFRQIPEEPYKLEAQAGDIRIFRMDTSL